MYLSLLVCSFVEMAPALLLESPYCQLYLLSEKLNQDSLCLMSWFSVTYFCNEFSFFVGKYFFGVRRREINIGMVTSLLGRQTISSVDSRYWRVLNKSSLRGVGEEAWDWRWTNSKVQIPGLIFDPIPLKIASS